MEEERIRAPNSKPFARLDLKGISMTNLLSNFEKELFPDESAHPGFRVGDTLKVSYKTKEGGRERIQHLEGLVTEKKHAGPRETFTIRRITHGVGVERSFALYSPRVEKIEVLKQGEVRRAKLFYLRKKVGKEARVKEKKG